MVNRSVFYARGLNKYNVNGDIDTIHAEVDAVQHLPFTNKKKKIDILVIRTNKKGNRLLMSKPCDHCLKYMIENVKRKGYTLKRIYYTENEKIIRLKI